jgi:hypothetical protein
MEKLGAPMHDERIANPFGILMEGPLQRSTTAIKHEPKINDSGDIGTFGSTHGGGDWG